MKRIAYLVLLSLFLISCSNSIKGEFRQIIVHDDGSSSTQSLEFLNNNKVLFSQSNGKSNLGSFEENSDKIICKFPENAILVFKKKGHDCIIFTYNDKEYIFNKVK